MSIFFSGLVIFLGIHSIGVFASEWRGRQISKIGDRVWKVLYSLGSIIALVLMTVGYKQHTAMANIVVWSPPEWTWYFLVYSNFIPLILLVAAYVPRNSIRVALKDPMTIGVMVWAATHLVNVGSLAGMILFGSFLVWGFIVLTERRKLRANMPPAKETASVLMTVLTIVLGLGLWSLFVRYAYYLRGMNWLTWMGQLGGITG